MKTIAYAAAGILLSLLLGLYPFIPREVDELLPVQLLEVGSDGLQIWLKTDNELSGTGKDYESAMEMLMQSAPGEAFFGSCAAVVLCGNVDPSPVLQDSRLRPAAALYHSWNIPEAKEILNLVSAHSGSVRLADAQQEDCRLPQIILSQNRWIVKDVS